MECDCGIVAQNHWFRYRTGGIIVCDGKMLFVKSAVGDYLYIVGGAVHLGETSKACIEREIFEEVGINVEADRLAVVCENFFKGHGCKVDGLDCHTVEFYFYITLTKDEAAMCNEKTDNGENLVWIPLADIEKYEIKPTCIKERIREILCSDYPIHIIEERDR